MHIAVRPPNSTCAKLWEGTTADHRIESVTITAASIVEISSLHTDSSNMGIVNL